MPTESDRQKIRALLSHREESLANLASVQKQYDEAAATAGRLEHELNDLGSPDYRDAEALDRIESLKRQLQACVMERDRLAKDLGWKDEMPDYYARRGWDLVAPFLADGLRDLLARITRILTPLHPSRAHAEEAATHTPKYRTAVIYFDSMRHLAMQSGGRISSESSFALQVEEMMRETLKEKSCFQRFFPAPRV